MDNLQIDITCEGDAGILKALEIIWPAACPGGKAIQFIVDKFSTEVTYNGQPTSRHSSQLVRDKDGVPTLILLWNKERDSQPLPYPLDLKQSAEFIRGWLLSTDYGREPDHDGDNGKGWRIFTEGWGHVNGCVYAIVGVQPVWAMYCK